MGIELQKLSKGHAPYILETFVWRSPNSQQLIKLGPTSHQIEHFEI